jgi:hypothetical protein
MVPFIPEIVIAATGVVAALRGCRAGQDDPCLIGSMLMSDIVSWALQLGAGFIMAGVQASDKWFIGFFIAMSVWLVTCYAVLLRGWTRIWTRLLLGLVAALAFAFLPYIGPKVALDAVVGYVGKVDDGLTHEATQMVLLAVFGAPLAAGIFVIYSIVVIALGVVSAKRRIALV